MIKPNFFSLAAALSGTDLLASATSVTTCSADPTAVTATTGTKPGSFCDGEVTLRSEGTEPGIFIIDHRVNVGGFPTFDVLSLSGDTSVFEVTYNETRALLDKYMGDGPIPLAASLDTYRRYQKFNLSTAGELTLSNLGVITAISTTPLANLPGSFQCSDNQLNQIWLGGARKIQQTEIPAGTTPEFYQMSDEGLFAESQAPQTYSSDTAFSLMQYKLDFSVKPMVGGFGYTALSNTLGVGIYVFVNTSNSSISTNAGSTERDSSPLAQTGLRLENCADTLRTSSCLVLFSFIVLLSMLV